MNNQHRNCTGIVSGAEEEALCFGADGAGGDRLAGIVHAPADRASGISSRHVAARSIQNDRFLMMLSTESIREHPLYEESAIGGSQSCQRRRV